MVIYLAAALPVNKKKRPTSKVPAAPVCSFLGRGVGVEEKIKNMGVEEKKGGCRGSLETSQRMPVCSPLPYLTASSARRPARFFVQSRALFSLHLPVCCSKSGRECGRLAISFPFLFSSDHPVYLIRWFL